MTILGWRGAHWTDNLHTLGYALLSSRQELPVFKFSVAALCQDAQMRKWPVRVSIRTNSRGTHYIAAIERRDAQAEVRQAE